MGIIFVFNCVVLIWPRRFYFTRLGILFTFSFRPPHRVSTVHVYCVQLLGVHRFCRLAYHSLVHRKYTLIRITKYLAEGFPHAPEVVSLRHIENCMEFILYFGSMRTCFASSCRKSCELLRKPLSDSVHFGRNNYYCGLKGRQGSSIIALSIAILSNCILLN